MPDHDTPTPPQGPKGDAGETPADPPPVLTRCRVDETIERRQVDGFLFPLGVYPVEDLEPKPGYTLDFESADGGDDSGEWEEWPDRYVFDAVLSAERVPNLVRCLIAIMPTKVFPILDVLGHDAFREIDPFVAYDQVGLDRLIEAIKQVPAFFFEDGLCGFGAMSEDPFFYFFVDEHKIVTVRVEAELKETVERLLAAFGLEQSESAAGVDAAAHEHRSVLIAPDHEPRMLNFDEIVEQLRDDWRLVLNIDSEENVDDEGKELGETGWWCRVRVAVLKDPADPNIPPPSDPSEDYESRYVEVVLRAGCLREAEDLATLAAERHAGLPPSDDPDDPPGADAEGGPPPPFVVFADRMTEEQFDEHRQGAKRKPGAKQPQVWSVRWAD